MIHRTETAVLVDALLELSRTLHSLEGVVEATLAEAAGRLRAQQLEIDFLREMWATRKDDQGAGDDGL